MLLENDKINIRKDIRKLFKKFLKSGKDNDLFSLKEIPNVRKEVLEEAFSGYDKIYELRISLSPFMNLRKDRRPILYPDHYYCDPSYWIKFSMKDWIETFTIVVDIIQKLTKQNEYFYMLEELSKLIGKFVYSIRFEFPDHPGLYNRKIKG